MKTLLGTAALLRQLELVCGSSPVSKVAILAPTPAAARQLGHLIASFFPIGWHELQIHTQVSFWNVLNQLRAKSLGITTDPLVGRLTSRQALQGALWSLPLDRFRPANAPEKYVLQLDAFFSDLLMSGIAPEHYVHFASANSQHFGEHSTVHNELARAYAAWLQQKGTVDVPQQVFEMLRVMTSGDTASTAALHAWRQTVQSEMRHVLVADAHGLGAPTLALLWHLFGPGQNTGGSGLLQGAADGSTHGVSGDGAAAPSVTAVVDPCVATPAAARVRAAVQTMAHAARHTPRLESGQVSANPQAYDWQLLDLPSAAAVSSPAVIGALSRVGVLQPHGRGHASAADGGSAIDAAKDAQAAGTPAGTRLKRRSSKAAPTPAADIIPAPTPQSALPGRLLSQLRPVYHQVLPGGQSAMAALNSLEAAASDGNTVYSGTDGPSEFVECLGFPADGHTDGPVARLVRWLVDEAPGPALSMLPTPGEQGSASSTAINSSTSRPRGGPTIAVLCRSVTAVRDISAALRLELADRLAGYSASQAQAGSGYSAGLPIRMYAETRGTLARVPEVRLLLGLLGVLSKPEDPQQWYSLACSPVYAIPPYVVSRWVKDASKDAEKRGIVFQIYSIAGPKLKKVKRSARSSSTTGAGATGAGGRASSAPAFLSDTDGSSDEGNVLTGDATAGGHVDGAGPAALRASLSSSRGLAAARGTSSDAGSASDGGSTDDVLALPGSGGDVSYFAGLSAASSDSDVELTGMSASSSTGTGSAGAMASDGVGMADGQGMQPATAALNVDPGTVTTATAARRLLEDLEAVHKVCKSSGSAGDALRTFLTRSGLERALTEPQNTAEADAAAAVAKLLEAVHALEGPDSSANELRTAAKRALGLKGDKWASVLAGEGSSSESSAAATAAISADSPLTGIPLVYEALHAAVYRGDLGLGLGFTAGADGVGLTIGNNADEDEDVIDVVPLVPDAPATPAVDNAGNTSSASDQHEQHEDGVASTSSTSAPSGLSPELQLELGASAADAVCQQSFAQVMGALEDEQTLGHIDAALARTEGGADKQAGATAGTRARPELQVKLQPFAPAAPLPTIFVTTLKKGVTHLYDYVVLPGCSAGAYPGPFLDNSLPLPAPLFAPRYLKAGAAGADAGGAAAAASTTDSPVVQPTTAVAAPVAAAPGAGLLDQVAATPLLPRPADKAEHVSTMRGHFFSALSSARYGVLVTCPAPTPSRPVSSATGRSRFVDELFGPPPQQLAVTAPQALGGALGSQTPPNGMSTDAAAAASETGHAAKIPETARAPAAAISSTADGTESAQGGDHSPMADTPPTYRGDLQKTDSRLRVSYSAISDFEWCPARYRWNRVESVGQPPSTVLMYGVALHAAVACAGEAVGDAVYHALGGRDGPLAPLLEAIQTAHVELGGSDEEPPRASSFDIATAALASLTTQPSQPGGLSPAVLQEMRARILARLPPVHQLEARMRSIYNSSWMALEDKYSKATWSAAQALLASGNGTAGGSNFSADDAAAGPAEAASGADVSRGQGGGQQHYTDVSAATFGFSARHLLALQDSAYPAITRVAALEMERLRAILTDEGAATARLGARGPGGMLLGLPTLVERRFDLYLPSHAKGPDTVRVTGVIDRVDMSLMPVNASGQASADGGAADGSTTAPRRKRASAAATATAAPASSSSPVSSSAAVLEALPMVREFKTSTQWKKSDDALRSQLRLSLQSDLYGVAVKDIAWNDARGVSLLATADGQAAGSGTSTGKFPLPPSLRPWSGSSVSVQLEGIETGQVEDKSVGAREMAIARNRILATCVKIKAGDFSPTPSEHKCAYCAYSKMCDAAYGHRPAVDPDRLAQARQAAKA